jgi:tRNA-Thr(GGU) m(6)t(6)A37 methyltransferase TsaA
MTPIQLEPIGIIHTPHQVQQGTPIQPFAARGVEGKVEVFPEFREGLTDLSDFERIWLLFWCHQAKPFELLVVPYQDVTLRGLFATRAPSRPNSIGLSTVRLLDVNPAGGRLRVADVDMLDGTPLLDIKPYVPDFDSYPEAKTGWLKAVRARRKLADGRFTDESDSTNDDDTKQ